MFKKLIVTGVMSLGFGLTSTLAAQPVVKEEKPKKVNSVAVIKKDDFDQYPNLIKPEKEVPINEFLREVDAAKEREVKQHHEFLRQQFLEFERERIEKERLARIEQERLARVERERVAKIERERQEQLERERQERVKRENEQRKLTQAKSEQNKPVIQDKPVSTSDGQSMGNLSIRFTYYSAFCDTGCTGRTATGHDVSNTVYYQGMRIVSVDPGLIPLYSIVRFELNGQMVKAIALDTGGHIKGHRIDMLVASDSEARTLGTGTKNVEILRRGR